jgi:transketolase
MAALHPNLYTEPEKKSTRAGFGDALVELGERNRDVVALTADLMESVKMDAFAARFPDRFFDMGVAEQNMVAVSAGMALAGKIPFAATFGVFLPGRSLDQVRQSVCYNQANVKLCASHTGLTVGEDGATHQALEDIAITRALPNLVVLVPCDYEETRKATFAAAEHTGPVYIRFGRANLPSVTTKETPFAIGKAEVFREGDDATVVACGPMVYEALMAAQEMAKDGLSVRVVNCPSIKPMDRTTIAQCARETGAVVTAEEHQVHGGLGGAVAEALAEECPTPMAFVGVQDRFGESGDAMALLEAYGLTRRGIRAAVERVMKRK